MANRIHITLLRHGRTRADDEDIKEGRFDSPLTEIGRSQAQARAQEFLKRQLKFDYVIASPLKRAHETAQIIAKILAVPLETDPDWMEKDIGPLTGRNWEEFKQENPIPDFRNPYEPFFDTGESNWEIYSRASKALEQTIRRGAGCYLVVAHGLILNAALRTIVGTQPSVNGQGIWFIFGDTGYIRTVYSPAEHRWEILEFKAS